VVFEVNLLLKLDPDANFIGSDPGGAAAGLKEVLKDTIYDLDDVKILEIDVEEA